MDPLLEVLLGKFNLADDVVLTIEKNGKKAYLKGTIAAIQEKYLLISTNGSVVRVTPESIIKVAKPQPAQPQRSSQKRSNKVDSKVKDNLRNNHSLPVAEQNDAKKQRESKKILKSSSKDPIRLNKFLSNIGICSRREADEYIIAGRVTINGKVITELGTKVYHNDEVEIHDSPLIGKNDLSHTHTQSQETINNDGSQQKPKTNSPVIGNQLNIEKTSSTDNNQVEQAQKSSEKSPKTNDKTSMTSGQETSIEKRPEDWNPKLMIPKMGDIISINGDELIILTNKKTRISTSRAIIIDKKLNKLINDHVVNKKQNFEIPVIWGEVDNEILCILGLNTLESINSRINTSRDVGNIKVAYALALLLTSHSTLPAYMRQLQSFNSNANSSKEAQNGSREILDKETNESFTKQGIKARESGDFERAIKLFQNAIDNNEGSKTTAFREMVNTLITMERFEDAYSILSQPGIMDFTSPLLYGRSQKNFTWLTNCLIRTGHDEKVIEINEIHANTEGITPKQKASCYYKIAEALLRIDVDGQEDKAEEYYKKALEADPTNKSAKLALSSLRPENFELDSGEEIIDMDSSSYAEDQMPFIPEDKRNKQYKESLKEQLHVLRYISYSERAETHLRLAAVEKALRHDSEMHMDLAKYLINTVLDRRKNNSLSSDAAIFMLCESVAHWCNYERYERYHGRDRRITHYQDCLALYINLFNKQNPHYFFNSPKLYTSFEYRLYETAEFYQSLPSFMHYRVPFSILMKELWETSAQPSAVNYLNEHNFTFSVEEGKDKFDQGFKTIANKDRANTSEIINRLRHMSRSAGYEELRGRLNEMGQPNLKNELDKKRFLLFKDFIENTLMRYFRNEDPTNKYYSQKDSLSSIESQLNEISEEPTRFSYDGLRPVLQAISNMIESDYKRISEISKPKIVINQSGDCSLTGDILSFQLNIANGNGCSAINNFHIDIINSEDVCEHVDGMKIVYRSLPGGEEINLTQQIRISPTAASSEVVTISTVLYYETVGTSDNQQIPKKISLHLRNDDIPTSNPYSRYAGGKPIDGSMEMFYGREDDIKSTADSMMSDEVGKQIIIYGQSRSGKTSFRNKLALELEQRGAWCAKFSLQNMNPPFSTGYFFAFIMESIINILFEEECWDENDYKYAVNNHATLINQTYRDTPESSISTLFTNDMCSLQRAVRKKWNKKLILMIDEFTELYTWIKKGLMPDNIMKIWKAVSEDERLDYSVVLIGQDTTPLFMLEPYASNPFQVIEPRRMGYLSEQDARKMIEEPILDREKKSRFLGKAVDKIIKYTAGSPYYLMIFCSRLVDYMKVDKNIGKVTDVDVEEVAKLCIAEKLNGKFDNLYAAIEPQPYEKERSQAVLKAIAEGMEKQKDGTSRADVISKLKGRYSEEEINQVLLDLSVREVVTKKTNVSDNSRDTFKIKVIIFQKWLLEN